MADSDCDPGGFFVGYAVPGYDCRYDGGAYYGSSDGYVPFGFPRFSVNKNRDDGNDDGGDNDAEDEVGCVVVQEGEGACGLFDDVLACEFY